MKKLLLLLFSLSIIQLSLIAQVKSDFDIPARVSNTFREAFPNALNTRWEKEGVFYTVKFQVQNNQSVHLVYDEQGQVVEKYMALPLKDVPEIISKFLTENRPGYAVQNYWVKQKGGERIYKVEVTSEFGGNGAIVGVSNGKGNTELNSVEGVATQVSIMDSEAEIFEALYFDKAGSSLTSTEALEGKRHVTEVKEDSGTVAKNKTGRRKR